MTRLLDIGLTGLNAHQRAINTTGHNIANANLEGYSRQETSFAALPPQFRSGVFVGSGVTVDAIRRITDEFIVAQSFVDTSRVGELEALDSGLRRLDLLLSSEETGLSPALNDFFASIQAVTESPSSLVLRDQVLNNAERYLTRFNAIIDQVEQIAGQVDAALAAQVTQINSIAASIADLNQQISLSGSLPAGSQPNDLLDQRDQLLRELAEYVSFTTSKDDVGVVNVFIGGGQALVLGSNPGTLSTISSGGSGNRLEIAIEQNGRQQIITSRVRGGQVGGLLQLRESGLDSSLNQLGLLQTQLSFAFNSLHRQGTDLNSTAGGDFFTAVNDPLIARQRVTADAANSANDTQLSVTLDQPSLLTTSSYTLRLSDIGSLLGYTVTRDNDQVVVGQGALPFSFPQTVVVDDGFSVNLESGTFQAGDRYTLRPARVAAGSVELLLANPESLALGLPVSTSRSSANLGQGVIQQVGGLSTSTLSLADQAQLDALRAATPPLLIQFTSATTYDLLDNSNPAQPADLTPPLRNLRYLPGQVNPILDFDPQSNLYPTVGAFAFTAAPGPISSTNNGYAGETISFTTTNSETGSVTTQNVTVLAGESAATLAARVSAVSGVSAVANTEISITLNDDAVPPVMGIRLNGVDLTDAGLGPVPDPLDTDFLATRINTLFNGAGIVAEADGSSLTIRSLTGEDLTLQNFNAGTDNFVVNSINGTTVTIPIPPVAGGSEVTVAGTVTVITGSDTILNSSGGYLGGSAAQALPVFPGYDIAISGQPQAGDEFFINVSAADPGDNRNALALAALQTADVLANSASLNDIYATLVGDVGGKAGAVAIDKQAAESILAQTNERLAQVSGVNLDEEAARLLQYEQAYNASARVISIARSLFDSLLGAFN